MRRTNLLLALLSFILIAAVIGWRTDALPSVMFGEARAQGSSVLAVAYALFVFLLTVLGIFLGQFYVALSPDRPQTPVLLELRAMLTSREFARSIVASPIVFGVVYALALRNPDPVMVIILSIQNGFFCHSVVNQVKRRSFEESVASASKQPPK